MFDVESAVNSQLNDGKSPFEIARDMIAEIAVYCCYTGETIEDGHNVLWAMCTRAAEGIDVNPDKLLVESLQRGSEINREWQNMRDEFVVYVENKYAESSREIH